MNPRTSPARAQAGHRSPAGHLIAAWVFAVARRAGVVVGVIGVLVGGVAGPALAHAGGLLPSDSRGHVTVVDPATPGLNVTAIEDGAKLRLVNDTGGPVTVTAGGGPATPYVVGSGDTYMWADTRSTPVGRKVAAGVTWSWTVPLSMGGSVVTVHGSLLGEKKPLPWPWWAGVALAAYGVPAACRRLRRGDLFLLGAGIVAAATSITHVVGSTFAVQSAPLVGTFFNAAGINLLAWPMIVGGVAATLRGRPAGLLAVCAGSALTAVFVLPDVTSFHHPVLPFDGPADLERTLVFLALGVGAGAAVAGAGVLRRLAAAAEAAETVDTEASADVDGSPQDQAGADSADDSGSQVADGRI